MQRETTPETGGKGDETFEGPRFAPPSGRFEKPGGPPIQTNKFVPGPAGPSEGGGNAALDAAQHAHPH